MKNRNENNVIDYYILSIIIVIIVSYILITILNIF